MRCGIIIMNKREIKFRMLYRMNKIYKQMVYKINNLDYYYQINY